MSCPICGRPTETRYRPFCSARCADIDLGRWMLGSYSIPDEAPPDTLTPGSRRPSDDTSTDES